MTVCIAGLFDWNYGRHDTPEWGRAGILMTDRMLTAGDVQYEPNQRKWASIGETVCLAVAGDISVHTQALKDTHLHLRGNPRPHPHDVAAIYGRAIQAIKRKEAEDLYLAPLGLNTDTLLAQTKEISPELTSALIARLHEYRGADVEALIVGSSQPPGARIPSAQIYTVDTTGIVNCWDDIGFAAIGIGAWHAKSRLMQSGFINILRFAPAIALLYAAKKASEVAPGVGRATDIQIIMRDSHFPLWENFHREMDRLYVEYDREREQLGWQSILRLNEFLGSAEFGSGTDAAQRPVAEDAGIDGSAPAATAETPRANETAPPESGSG